MEGVKDFAATIRDLTTCSVMVIGAGIARVNALKENAPLVDGDPEERLKNGDAQAVKTSPEAWAEGNGVVQLKFEPKGGWHTLAEERIPPDGAGEPTFRFYQSCQSSYRLSDSLGRTSREPPLARIIAHNQRDDLQSRT